MFRTHWTLPRALHDERRTCGDQDGHLLVQHVPRPLRPRPVCGHHDRLRGEGLEDVSGKSKCHGDPRSYRTSSLILDLLLSADFLPLAPLLHHARVPSLAHREQAVRRGEGRRREGRQDQQEARSRGSAQDARYKQNTAVLGRDLVN